MSSQQELLQQELVQDEQKPELSDDQKKSQKEVTSSYWSFVKHQFKKNKLAVISLYIVILLIIVAVFADFLAYQKPIYTSYNGQTYFPIFKDYAVSMGLSKWDPPELINISWKKLDDEGKLGFTIWPLVTAFGPGEIDLSNTLTKPGVGNHILGTDPIGRDLLSGLIHGSRISLSVGFVAAGIAVLIGVLLGSIAGFYGGTIDILIMRFVEIMYNIPTFFLILVIVAIYGSSIWYIMAAIGLTAWTTDAKLVRGEVLKVRGMEYIVAANSVGLPNRRILLRHVLPNAIAPVLVSGAFAIASAILIEAALSFLGVGVKATTVTWGSLINLAREASSAWWLAIFPGIAIFVTVVSYNLIGEGLRDALDPRLRD
jgi:peptide/nickel transport system permease protein